MSSLETKIAKGIMFFLLTNYIYPIKEPITLSTHFGFSFDNPRTKAEVEAVRELVRKSWELSETVEGFQFQRLPMKKEVPGQDVVTFEQVIEEFFQKHFGDEKAKERINDIKAWFKLSLFCLTVLA